MVVTRWTRGIDGRLFAIIGASTLLSACARNVPRTSPVVGAAFSFVAQSRPDSLLEGSFAGTAVIGDGWISVKVKPALTFPAGQRERWRSVTIRSFVAADYGGGSWRAAVASTPVNVWRYLDFPRGPSEPGKITIPISDTLRFEVPIPRGASLERARLGFEIEWVTLYKDYGQTEQNYAFSGPLPASRPPSP